MFAFFPTLASASFTPGQTLDPSCLPSDPTCLVVAPPTNIAGTFTATSTATSSFAGGFTIGTTGFVYQQATGNVGLGIINPGYLLDVNGTGHFSGLLDAANLIATSTTATSTFAGGFNVANGGLLYDRSTGNVGINTTSPRSQLDVAGKFTSSVVGSVGQTISTSFNGSSMAARGNYVYSLSHTVSVELLVVTDISNPALPTIMSTSSLVSATCGGELALLGQYVYADTYCGPSFSGGSINVFDISNPKIPKLLSSGGGGILNNSAAFGAQGSFAYGGDAGGLRVRDISNPYAVVNVINISLGSLGVSGILGLTPDGHYIYTVNTTSPNFNIIDMSNITSPTKVGSLVLSDAFTSTTYPTPVVSGKYVYVKGDTTISIIDVSDPTNPTLAGTITPPTGTPRAVRVSGRNAYVAQSNGVAVYDVSNVAAPVYLGLLTTTFTTDLVISGRYAITSAGEVLNLGGAYIQQLEAGGLFAESLSVKQTARFM
ncbi:MAG: hypothetical protein JWO50_90, partial [Candidatus Kaiserbacteria bacterium]|nr:hypothetical protein [Candidatus Kaiserbacteria bacterium]